MRMIKLWVLITLLVPFMGCQKDIVIFEQLNETNQGFFLNSELFSGEAESMGRYGSEVYEIESGEILTVRFYDIGGDQYGVDRQEKITIPNELERFTIKKIVKHEYYEMRLNNNFSEYPDVLSLEILVQNPYNLDSLISQVRNIGSVLNMHDATSSKIRIEEWQTRKIIFEGDMNLTL